MDNDKLTIILDILKNESESYRDAVSFLFKIIIIDKEQNRYDIHKFGDCTILVHNKLRNKYKVDFNSPLLCWYRRFIGLYKE